jgi:hypothetical protein
MEGYSETSGREGSAWEVCELSERRKKSFVMVMGLSEFVDLRSGSFKSDN